ncbi:MAG: protein kinase [Chthoniobacteraceae bacterium]
MTDELPAPLQPPDGAPAVTLQIPAEMQNSRGLATASANPDATVPYRFGGEIARGGMGSILEAADCKLGRIVAVKIMLSEMGADAEQRQRFINEAEVLARLAHPNIVPVYDIGRDEGGHIFYTMKLVKGRTLRAILDGLREGDADTAGHYTLDRLLTVFRKVCDALAFAHSRGIIHRDLKPENIMVGEFGEVLVMDWGLAKQMRSAECEVRNEDRSATRDHSALHTPHSELGAAPPASDAETILSDGSDAKRRDALRRLAAGGDGLGMTIEGSVMGTPQYMSPEQASGRIAEMDARSDIFSLGGILYTIVTLRRPVEGTTLEEVLRKVASGSITAPSEFDAPTGQSQRSTKGEVIFPRKSGLDCW